MNKTAKSLVFWFVILLSAVLLWQVVKAGSPEQRPPEISYSQFLSEVEAGKVAKVTIANREILGARRNGTSFQVIAPNNQEALIGTLRENAVEIWFKDLASANWPMWLMNLAPMILLAALWFFMIRQMRTAQNRMQVKSPAESLTGFVQRLRMQLCAE